MKIFLTQGYTLGAAGIPSILDSTVYILVPSLDVEVLAVQRGVRARGEDVYYTQVYGR